MWMDSPVLGLRPWRAERSLTLKFPNPAMLATSPLLRAVVMDSKTFSTARLAEAFGLDNRSGALISRVEPDSPAEEAGLQSGDVVLSVDHRKVDSASDLRNIIGLMRVGQEARINFWRKGRMMSVDILLRERRMRQVAGAEFHHRLRGALLKELKPDEDDGDEGVQVAEVEEGSPAADAGLRGGDIIVSVNRHAVASLQQMREAVGLERGRLLLLIKRDESAFYLALR